MYLHGSATFVRTIMNQYLTNCHGHAGMQTATISLSKESMSFGNPVPYAVPLDSICHDNSDKFQLQNSDRCIHHDSLRITTHTFSLKSNCSQFRVSNGPISKCLILNVFQFSNSVTTSALRMLGRFETCGGF